MRIDLRYVGVESELWALQETLRSLEPTIDELGQRFEDRIFGELARTGFPDDEAERGLAWQTVHDLRDFVLPYQLRNGYLVMLWAGYELSIGAVGVELAAFQGHRDRSAQSFGPPLTKAGAAFARLGIALEPDASRLRRLEDLYEIRNAIVHNGGRKAAVHPERWEALIAVAARHAIRLESWRDALLAQPAYPPLAFADVADSLRGLVARAKALPTARRARGRDPAPPSGREGAEPEGHPPE